jgi:histidinol dehydrogenase
MGGVYAVAALAYGTQSIRKVEKIVGPGNAYVTAAKKFVYGDVAIDMVAGPSEIMVIADNSNKPDFIAADMLSQAEHGSGHEQAVLLSTSHALIERVKDSLEKQVKKLKRSTAIKKIMSESVILIETENIEQSIELANSYAPEHLEIMCKGYENIAEKITAAGAIFLGEYTPEPVGDFVAGPSHVLPTGGSAKHFSGITIDTFLRRSSLIKYSKQALEREMPFIERFADMEGLDAHGNSALIRFGDYIGL